MYDTRRSDVLAGTFEMSRITEQRTKPSKADDNDCSSRRQFGEFDNVDLSSIFPTSKIKAQILRDEGVGRVSTKAIHLIGACSGILMRELAEESAADVAAKNAGNRRKPSCSSSRGVGRKRKIEQSTATQSHADNSAKESSALKRDDVKAWIEKDTSSYDFLHGLLSEQVSAKDTPSYGDAYRNKKRRDAATARRGSDGNAIKGNKSSSSNDAGTSSTAAVAITSVLGGSAGAAAASSGRKSRSTSCTDAINHLGDEETLCSLIDASTQGGNIVVRDGIVEDKEEYD